ncbi:hypothetical protein M9H77_29431 [Catharanthus roseus]|uniref:Uncharacterized protein n=1 Tax=Catharanthus roseus TaxID=4058 RepID=A0ACB9ZWB9_CATRO|nr:hypothetical protein M9H77_29431 [Catharanthus roseus]
MEYNWSNSSWKRMEVKSKQEIYQSKLTRDMHSFLMVVAMGSVPMVGTTIEMEISLLEDMLELVKELAQAKIEESLKIHVVDETSKEEPCCIMNEQCIEIKEKERVEEKERLAERSCIFGSISITSKESEHFEYAKEKEKKKLFIEFNSDYCAIPRVDECHFNIANYVSYVLGIEDQGRNMEKELEAILEELLVSLSLNPSPLCYKVSPLELELFLEFYLSYVSIYGDLCAISFSGGLFLVVPYVSKCPSHALLEDSLLHNDSMFDPSCYGFHC